MQPASEPSEIQHEHILHIQYVRSETESNTSITTAASKSSHFKLLFWLGILCPLFLVAAVAIPINSPQSLYCKQEHWDNAAQHKKWKNRCYTALVTYIGLAILAGIVVLSVLG